MGSEYDLAIAMATLLIDSGSKYSEELQEFLEKTYGGKCYLTYKGREALLIGLKLLQLVPGSLVAVTGFTCKAIEETLTKVDLKPIYLDIDEGLNFSVAQLKRKVKENPKIRAVMVQNTLGLAAKEMKEIAKFCQEKNIYLIEDTAHSLGAMYGGKTKVGRIGDLVTMSFGEGKAVGAVAGGALLVRSPKLLKKPLQKILTLSEVSEGQQFGDRFYPLGTLLMRGIFNLNWGLGRVVEKLLLTSKDEKVRKKKEDKEVKFFGLPNWEAGLVMNNLADLEVVREHRRGIARVYLENINSVYLPKIEEADVENGAWLRFYIMVPPQEREGLLGYLRLHKFDLEQTWYETGYGERGEKMGGEIINLPTHRNIDGGRAQKLAEVINDYMAMTMKERENLVK